MDEAEEPVVVPPAATFTVVAGGRSTVLTEMARAHKLYVIEPKARSRDQFRRKQEADIIRRDSPPQLEENADAVAEDLASERAVPLKNMRSAWCALRPRDLTT